MGYLVVLGLLVGLSYFGYTGIRRFRGSLETKEARFGLVSRKFERDNGGLTDYFIVFQIRDQEEVLQVPFKTYVQLQPPIRGKLFMKKNHFDRFEI